MYINLTSNLTYSKSTLPNPTKPNLVYRICIYIYIHLISVLTQPNLKTYRDTYTYKYALSSLRKGFYQVSTSSYSIVVSI